MDCLGESAKSLAELVEHLSKVDPQHHPWNIVDRVPALSFNRDHVGKISHQSAQNHVGNSKY
jgi:hypothetical protein